MIETFKPVAAIVLVAFATFAASDAALAAGDHNKPEAKSGATSPAAGGMMKQPEMMGGGGLMMPMMNPARGRTLFAAKACVVCHAVNGIGGKDAPAFDASTMTPFMNPFDFAAKMWRGAEAMIYLQQEEVGEQIELTGQELADIIAFTHDAEEQGRFSEGDIPPRVKVLMHHMDEEEPHEDEGGHGADKRD